ncbi:MAG: prepilin-type N-terminal cleavage/methylation domain-containing protein [Elusimicrobiaceae bacterium]|nr:prepilin-type N-terminal cleavage/methylation domain-containing protein [Elusimicrobiaceae bacterium]
MKYNKQAFTLVELLVVVLIIAVLSAIAIPMYQGAIDKSRWSTLLTPAKALQTAQAAAYLENGSYAYVADALTISLPGETDDNQFVLPDAEYSLETKSNNQSTITGQLNTLPNVKLSMSLKAPNSYLFCEAKTGDSRAERLCEKLLMGTKTGSKDGYTKYLLDNDGTCVWGSTTGECYNTVEEKCNAAGALGVLDGKCRYKNNREENLEDGSVCIGDDDDGGCNSLDIDGGICVSTSGRTCHNDTFTNGSICVSNKTGSYSWGGCAFAQFTNGSICYANAEYSCGNHVQDTQYWANEWGHRSVTTYDETSCCCGTYCGKAPSCASRGITCDPYYMDPNNFKNL